MIRIWFGFSSPIQIHNSSIIFQSLSWFINATRGKYAHFLAVPLCLSHYLALIPLTGYAEFWVTELCSLTSASYWIVDHIQSLNSSMLIDTVHSIWNFFQRTCWLSISFPSISSKLQAKHSLKNLFFFLLYLVLLDSAFSLFIGICALFECLQQSCISRRILLPSCLCRWEQ